MYRQVVVAVVFLLSTSDLVNPKSLCLEQLVSQMSPTNTLVVYTSEISGITITNATVYTVNLDSGLDKLDELEKPNLYIFVKVDLERLALFLDKLYRVKCWGSDVKTLYYGYEDNQLSKLFELSWKFFMHKVLVVTTQLNVFSFYPLSSGKCQSTEHHILGHCMMVRIHDGVFTKTALKAFKGCVLKVMAIPVKPLVLDKTEKEYPGSDQKILLQIMSTLQIETKYVEHKYPDWGTKLQNGSYTNLFQEIYSGNIDLTLSTALRLPYLHDFDYTINYISVSVPYWTAFPPEKPHWIHLTLVFTWPVWLCLAMALFLVIVTSFLCKMKESKNYSSAGYCALNVWRSLFSPSNSQPSSTALKCLFLVWSLCCYIITSSYQGCMIPALFKILHEPQLHTLEDLANSDLQYGGNLIFGTRIYEKHSPLTDKIFANYIPCTPTVDCLLRVAQQKDFAVFRSTYLVHYDLNTFGNILLNLDGSPKIIRSAFELHFDFGFIVRKGAPYLNRMNVLIFRLKESGIISMWNVYEKSSGYAAVGNIYKKISLSHLFLAFVALGVGYTFALLAFIIEHNTVAMVCRKLWFYSEWKQDIKLN